MVLKRLWTIGLKSYALLALALFLVIPRTASPAGSVVSEGDGILRADLARATFGVTGRAVRVGVISGGLRGLDQAKATEDLPLEACGSQSSGQTIIDPDLCQGIGVAVDTDAEGTAMMEIIHDLAPGAELLFCTPRTRLDMVACINFLAARVKVIVDDFGFLGEGYFEDGMVAQAAANAVATGVVFVSAAGNEADVHYQGMYVNSGDGMGSHLIGLGNTSFDVTGSGVVVVLQWSNRFGAAADNYDLCLVGETPEECASFNSVQNGDDDPLEARLCPAGCNLQVRLVSGAPQLLELFFIGGTLAGADQVAADSVFGHPAVPGVLAVAAIDANDPSHDDVEIFSSRGPSTIMFPTPEIRQKPNFAAIDNALISGAGGFPDPQGGSPQRFRGTSAATPHAAAVVVLMLEANPHLTPAEVQQILQQTTVPLGSSIPNFGSGFGRIDAFAAVQTVKLQATPLLAAVLPSSRSVQVGTPATVFATIINSGLTAAGACELAPLTPLAATFGFQATDPSTNQITGQPNTPVDIPAGVSQSFVFTLTPTAPFAPIEVTLSFDCVNTEPALSVTGVNTLLLSASATPIPDIVALAATLSNDGTVHIPGTSGTGVFAVATVNVGATGTITIAADTGGASLPVSILLCETSPMTGTCLAPPSNSVTTQIAANATPTFDLFVTGGGLVRFAPMENRIFVRFLDAGGVTRGSTSVAVRTQ